MKEKDYGWMDRWTDGRTNERMNLFYLFIYLIQLQYKLNIQHDHIVEQYNQTKDEKANKQR